jgi:hypothetical protein
MFKFSLLPSFFLLSTLFQHSASQNSSTSNHTNTLTSTSSSSSSINATASHSISSNVTSTSLPPGQSVIQVTIQVYTSTIGLPSSTPSSNSTLHNSNSTQPKLLDTQIGATFGILGAILLATGLPMALLGGRNRW